MTHVLRIAHLRIALHVANPEVGNREGIREMSKLSDQCEFGELGELIDWVKLSQ